MTEILLSGSEEAPLSRALRDLRSGLTDWKLWGFLGWHDIRQRYRRSTLGPLWVALSMAVNVAAIGLIWGTLFGLDARGFVPYLCLGMLTWNLILGIINDGCQTFIGQASGFITHINRPLSTYVFWVIWRNLLIALHTFIVYVGVAIVFGIVPNQNTLMILLSLPLLIFAIAWAALFFGLISARFRDIPQIVQSILTVAFFVTPVLWKVEQLGARAYLAAWNPMTHLMELVRAPLLGDPIFAVTWAAALATGVAGWAVTLLIFTRCRARLPYWL
ncbi:MAG: ABC transporter permease [Myxococcota bacterium]